MSSDMTPILERLLLKEEVTEFMSHEADLLDSRQYREWLGLCTDDIRYEVPLSINVKHDELHREQSRPGKDICWFDESKETLEMRIMQIETGAHWAEEPLSRTVHAVTNIRLTEVALPEVKVSARFIIYRSRVNDEVDLIVGRRVDTLRKTGEGWRLAGRYALIAQNVLLSKSLTIPF